MAHLKSSGLTQEAVRARALARELSRVRPNPTGESVPSPKAQSLGLGKKALRAALELDRKDAPEPRAARGRPLRGSRLDIFI